MNDHVRCTACNGSGIVPGLGEYAIDDCGACRGWGAREVERVLHVYCRPGTCPVEREQGGPTDWHRAMYVSVNGSPLTGRHFHRIVVHHPQDCTNIADVLQHLYTRRANTPHFHIELRP